MGGNCTKSNPNDVASIKSSKDKNKPITINLGSDPMIIGINNKRFSPDYVKSPKNQKNDPEFLAAKVAQYNGCMELINAEVADPFSERAFGCIIGAFIGDSCGSYIEFDELYASKNKIEACMKMPGGGYH